MMSAPCCRSRVTLGGFAVASPQVGRQLAAGLGHKAIGMKNIFNANGNAKQQRPFRRLRVFF
jgi:hypothetical protein